MKVKNRTCITIIQTIVNNSNFNEYLNIPHNVDCIVVNSIGSYFIDAVPAIVDSAFYVKSDLVSNIHDNILGVFGNFNHYYQSTRMKEFRFPTKTISGTFQFQVFDLATKSLVVGSSGNIHIDLQFIEYEKE